jgi:hypothetical protein
MSAGAGQPEAGEGVSVGSDPRELDAEGLRARLEARGVQLRPEDEAATLATARFLLRAAELVRRATA